MRWTEREERLLTFRWRSVRAEDLPRVLPGRSLWSIYSHARRLGLPLGTPQGMVSVHEASRISGYTHSTVHRILRWAGVGICFYCYGPRSVTVRRWGYVEREVLLEALARWHRAEEVPEAARRLGVSTSALREWLCRAGAVERVGSGHRARVPTETIDRVAAKAREKWAIRTGGRSV